MNDSRSSTYCLPKVSHNNKYILFASFGPSELFSQAAICEESWCCPAAQMARMWTGKAIQRGRCALVLVNIHLLVLFVIYSLISSQSCSERVNLLPAAGVCSSEIPTLKDIFQHEPATDEWKTGKYGNKNLWNFFFLKAAEQFSYPQIPRLCQNSNWAWKTVAVLPALAVETIMGYTSTQIQARTS